MDLEPTVPGAMLWQIRACKWQKERKANKQAFTWMLLKQSILETADVAEAKKRKTQLMPETPEMTRRPKLSQGLPTGVGMVASQQEWNPDEVYEYAFAAAMAAVKASETRTCHTCSVVCHMACNCPTTNPNAAAVQQRLSRWDPRSGGNKAGSRAFAPVAYGQGCGYRGGPAGGINSGPVGGMNCGPAGHCKVPRTCWGLSKQLIEG
eukprot:1345785-Rhodomonas_salina.1